jgi:outer membrane protein assembly factor BamB
VSARPGANLYTSSLVALGLNDGKLAWHYQDRPHDLFDWDFQSTPVRVRAAAMSGADLVIGAGKTGAVVALDAQSGKLAWRTQVGKHLNDDLSDMPEQSITIFPGVLGGVMSPLAYADGVLYAPSVDLGMSYDGALIIPEVSGGTGNLTAIDVRDGKVLWSATTVGACYGAATIANDLVLTSDENGRVYAFARASGEELWHYDAPGGIIAPLVIAGDDLIVSVGLNSGAVIALSLSAVASTAPATAGAAGMPAAAPAGEPRFSAVYRDVVQAGGCIGGPTCHASSSAGALDMSTQSKAYAALVGVKAMGADCSNTGLARVAPNDAANSLLMHKLEDTPPICGQRMPPSGALRTERIEQLRAWIQDGARDD